MIGLSSSASERSLGLPDTEIADRGDRVAETTAAVGITIRVTTDLAALAGIDHEAGASGSKHMTGLVRRTKTLNTLSNVTLVSICDSRVGAGGIRNDGLARPTAGSRFSAKRAMCIYDIPGPCHCIFS